MNRIDGTSKLLLAAFFLSYCCSAGAATVEYFDFASFAAAVNGTRTVVTFDDVPTETVLAGNEYAGLSISARRIAVIDPQDFAPGLTVGGANINSQPNGISASLYYANPGSIVFDNLDDSFTFAFAASTTAAGLWIGNVGANDSDPITPTIVTFRGVTGAPLASEAFTQGHVGEVGSGASNRFFYGVIADVRIGGITTINGAGDGDGIIYDDVQWVVVPEPSGVVLAALAGLGLLMLRFKHKWTA